MHLREDIYKWLEKTNPLLLFEKLSSVEILNKPKKIKIFSDTEVLIVLGVDKYEYIPALKKGIKVLVVEDDQVKISSFLLRDDFIPDENLFLAKSDKEQILPIIKQFVFKKVQYEGNLSTISSYIDGMHMSFSEYRDLGEKILPNILGNLLHIDRYIDGRDLIGLLEGEEAVVFGSGISLKSGIKEIKNKKKRPFIFSVGSSLPLLIKEGIIPDFFVIIDPDPPLSLYKCLKDLSIPIFYQNRANKDLLFRHNGLKIFMGSSRGWKIEDSIIQEMGRENFSFDAGCHAGNFGAHIALALGCKKVVLVGMDGIAKQEEEVSFEKDGKATRGDLFYGMEFFNTLKEEFPDQKLYHYTEGFCFDIASKIDTIDIKNKQKIISLPKENIFDQTIAKRVIDQYFDHQMLSSLQSFFVKIKEDKSMIKPFSACILAEFSLQPFYLYYLCPLWDIWKYILKEKDDILCKLTFFYSILNLFSKKTGYENEYFYLFGRKEGSYAFFDKNKILREKGYYYDDKYEKYIKQYGQGKELIVYQEMCNGMRDGKYKVYQNRQLTRDGAFVEGKAHGRHCCYEKDKIIDEIFYDMGEKVSTHKYFSKSGVKLEEIIYKENGYFDRFAFTESGQNKYSGIWKGKIFYEKFYDNGKVILSRCGKIINNKMVYTEDTL